MILLDSFFNYVSTCSELIFDASKGLPRYLHMYCTCGYMYVVTLRYFQLILKCNLQLVDFQITDLTSELS
jgi:hypothetical protein